MMGQRRDRRHGGFPPQHVDHNVKSPACDAHQALGEVAVERHGDRPQPGYQLKGVRITPDRHHHRRPACPGKLHGHLTDPSGRPQHGDALPGNEPGTLQRETGGDAHHARRRRQRIGDTGG